MCVYQTDNNIEDWLTHELHSVKDKHCLWVAHLLFYKEKHTYFIRKEFSKSWLCSSYKKVKAPEIRYLNFQKQHKSMKTQISKTEKNLFLLRKLCPVKLLVKKKI